RPDIPVWPALWSAALLPLLEADAHTAGVTAAQRVVQGLDHLGGTEEVEEAAVHGRITIEQVGHVREQLDFPSSAGLEQPGHVQVGVEHRAHRVVVDVNAFHRVDAADLVAVLASADVAALYEGRQRTV